MKLGSESQKLINSETGALAINGWEVNQEQKILVNHQDAAPISISMPALNKIKFRSWNYFLLHTKDHVI